MMMMFLKIHQHLYRNRQVSNDRLDGIRDELLLFIDQGRKRLNGTSTYRVKEKENKHPIKSKETETIPIDQTVNQLLEEQARIDAHSLAIQIN